MKNIIVKTNTANKTLAQKVLQSKDSLVDKIQAQSNVNYELIDQTTGLAPKKVIAKRTGDDLLLSFEDSKQIDLILENYYQHNANILGLAEDGSYYQYFSNSHLLNELPQNLAQIQNLGANPTTSAWWATTTTSAINASISTGTILGVVGGISVAGVAVSAGKKNKVSKPVQPPKDETTKPVPIEEETKPPVAPKPPVETISPTEPTPVPPKDETTKPAPTEEETKPPVAPKPPVETISPTEPTPMPPKEQVTITIEKIANDNFINVSESHGVVTVTGRVSGGDAKEGQTVTIKVGNHSQQAQLQKDLSFTANIQGKHFKYCSGQV